MFKLQFFWVITHICLGVGLQVFGRWPSGANKTLLADVISLLAMTMSKPSDETPESLKYRLLGSAEEIGSWGHEYVRNLAGEIGSDYQRRQVLPWDFIIDE